MDFFSVFSILVSITFFICFYDNSSNYDKIKIILKEVQAELQTISNTQESFNVKARNCDITFYKDFFRVSSKFWELNNGNISYSDISSIECFHESSKLKIKINLTSYPSETLKFYDYFDKGPSFETYFRNYLLVKLFLQNYKKIKIKKGE